MVKERWNYDSTFTVRVEQSTKDRLCQAAEAQKVPFSEYIRNLLENGMMPNDLCELLPESYRERVERQALKEKNEPGEIVLRLIRMGLPYALDNMHFGF